MRLLPREEKFYHLFQQQVQIISQASKLLLEGVRAGNSRMKTAAVEIDVLERKGDEVIHEIFTRLNQTFITPLDPEDIHNLSSKLDDVLDGIEEAAHCVVAYHIDPIPGDMVAMAQVVASCSNSMIKAFAELEKGGPIMEHCIEINRLENEGDGIGRNAVAALFENETNAVTVIKLKECYDILEATVDSCEDVADVLQNVVVKNS
jgi:predicted phosphate transport protein (TIGR00153 family)